MGWAVGYDEHWERDIGYGVPGVCDYPGCGAEIDRGLAYVCGSEPYGGDHGCGLYFCGDHLWYAERGPDGQRESVSLCQRCQTGQEPFEATPDTDDWTHHKATHPSWEAWRQATAEEGQGG